MFKKKILLFDLDGTFVDLYSVEDWLSRLRKESVLPYLVAKPIYDPNILNPILKRLKEKNYKIKVVTWGSKGGTDNFLKRTQKAKEEWLKKHGFIYDKMCCIHYGVNKANFIEEGINYLVDDSQDVRRTFLNTKSDQELVAVDAKNNILDFLRELAC